MPPNTNKGTNKNIKGFRMMTLWPMDLNKLGTGSFTVRSAGSGELEVRVTEKGPTSIKYKGKVVAVGEWLPGNPKGSMPKPVGFDYGAVTKSGVAKLGDGSVVVTYLFGKLAVVQCRVTAVNSDLSIQMRVLNKSLGRVVGVVFRGLTFDFGGVPTKDLVGWDWSYLTKHGWSLANPGFDSPLGCWRAGGPTCHVGFMPLNQFGMARLVKWEFFKPTDRQRKIEYYVRPMIEPGETKEFTLAMRFAPNDDWKNLFEPYQKNYAATFPVPLYQGDARPIVYHTGVAKEFLTDNPYGYHSNGLFHLPEKVQSWVESRGGAMAQYGYQGAIFWALGGYVNRGDTCMYRSDFNNIRPELLTNIKNLLNGLGQKGLRRMMLSRPPHHTYRVSDALDGYYDFTSPDKAGEYAQRLAELKARYEDVIGWGVTGGYMDCFASNPDHQVLLEDLRKYFNGKGLNYITYSEQASDGSLPYSGVFLEVGAKKNSQGKFELVYGPGFSETLWQTMLWLLPDVAAVAQLRVTPSEVPLEQTFRWCLERRIMPLTPSFAIVEWGEIFKKILGEYVDPNTKWWRK